MRSLYSIGVYVLVLCAFVSGQTVTDTVLPPGLPSFSGPFFADSSSVTAVNSGSAGGMYVFNGLPASGAFNFVAAPTTGSWRKFSDSLGAFEGAAFVISVVSGLPSSPVVTNFTTGAGIEDLVLVNEMTLVAATATGFEVLRLDLSGALRTFIPTSQPLILGSGYEAGAASGSTAFAFGVGADGAARTTDDVLIALDGLDGPLSNLSTRVEAINCAFNPTNAEITKQGGIMLWRTYAGTPGGVDFHSIQVLSGSVQTSSGSFTFIWGPSFGVPPILTVSSELVGSDAVHWSAYSSPARGHVTYTNLSQGPELVFRGWSDNVVSYLEHEFISDRMYEVSNELLLAPVSIVRTNSAQAGYFSITMPSVSRHHRVVPNERTVAHFSDNRWDGGGTLEAWLSVHTDNQTSAFMMTNEVWTQAGNLTSSARHAFAMGPGKVAGFHRTGWLPLSPPTGLRICSFPVASSEEARGKRGSEPSTSISIAPDRPRINQALTLQMDSVGGTGPIWLGLTNTRAQNSVLLSANETLWMPTASLLPVYPFMPNATGSVQLVIPPSTFSQAEVGVPFYLQAASWVNGQPDLSDLALVIYGQ